MSHKFGEVKAIKEFIVRDEAIVLIVAAGANTPQIADLHLHSVLAAVQP